MDLVSVVITTYGRSDTLGRAVDSVLNQTYHNLEIIIVDDNRDSEIRKGVIETVSACNDPRIKLIQNRINMGGALARNEGIKASHGKYIAFLDDDDAYYPQKIEKQMELFNKRRSEKLALVYCYCDEKQNGSIKRKYHYDFVGNCIFQAMVDCIAATSQWLCKKDALIDVGMFTDTPCKQDSYLMIKLLAKGYLIDRVPEYLSVYNTDSTVRISTSGHDRRIVGEGKLRDLCRDHYALLNEKQIEEVEYSFACRLMEHYYATGQSDNFILELKKVLRHPLRRRTLAAVKHTWVVNKRGKGDKNRP